jgi:hypothetical protein
MSNKLLILAILSMSLMNTTKALCNCGSESFKKHPKGLVCGSFLNFESQTNNCDYNIFICGKSNINKTAVVYKQCSQGNGCDLPKSKN